MKKVFITMATAALSLSAAAADFNGSFGKDLNGNGTISVVDNENGTAKVTISGVKVNGEDVGNLELNSVKLSTVGKFQLLSGAASDGYYDVCFLGQVDGSKITAKFNLTREGKTISATFGETRYDLGQLLGSDFEQWHTATFSSFTGSVSTDEPDGWHSFTSGKAASALYNVALKNKHTSIADDVRPGSTGSKSLKLVSCVAMGVPANGTVTTGRLHAGSTTPADAKNNATSDPTTGDSDNAGDPFYAPLNTRPDSIAVWVKFKQGAMSDADKAQYPYATLSAVLTDGTKYQDPEDKTYSNIVAKAQNKQIAENGSVWQRVVVPFTYTDAKLDPKAMLVTLSTNAQPGVGPKDGSNPDVLYIDDLSLVYNAQLASLKVNGVALEGFASDKYTYDLALGKDESLAVDYTTNAQSATTSMRTITAENGNRTIYITVTSADLNTTHTYTVNVKSPRTYTDQLLIKLEGDAQDPEQANIDIIDEGNDQYTFVLKQFKFGEMLIGDVTITGVPGTLDEDGCISYKVEKDATITNGANIAEALGNKVHVNIVEAYSKDDKLYAFITLPVDLMGDVINVEATFGTNPHPTVAKKTYTDNLQIYLEGDAQEPEQATIEVAEEGNDQYTFVLKQFKFGSLLIGDVTITGVPGTLDESNGYVSYKVEKDATITNGADIAEALGNKVHVNIVEAYSKDNELYALITLPVELMGDVINVKAVFGNKPAAGINNVNAAVNGATAVYTIDGVRLNGLQRGLNIVRTADGKVIKVMK